MIWLSFSSVWFAVTVTGMNEMMCCAKFWHSVLARGTSTTLPVMSSQNNTVNTVVMVLIYKSIDIRDSPRLHFLFMIIILAVFWTNLNFRQKYFWILSKKFTKSESVPKQTHTFITIIIRSMTMMCSMVRFISCMTFVPFSFVSIPHLTLMHHGTEESHRYFGRYQ